MKQYSSVENIFDSSRKQISPKSIEDCFIKNPSRMLAEFYEMQTQFVTIRYQMNLNSETSNILTLLGATLHLEIFRMREKNLDFNISLKNFLKINEYIRTNVNSFNHGHNIISIVKETGIPKETVRRKLKKLIEKRILAYDKKNKLYSFNLSEKNEQMFVDFIEKDIESLAKFIMFISKTLKLNLQMKNVVNEIKNRFSFYYYHYYTYQLKWMKMWRSKIKDIDLIVIAIQTLIPTLSHNDKNLNKKNLDLDNIHTIIGRTPDEYSIAEKSVGATSISQITNIPRATCIRKLSKLVKLGMLKRENKTKRYFVNQTTSDRTKNIVTKENIFFTIKNYSELMAIIINNIMINQKIT